MSEPAIDKDLLRAAGEHLGTLAERAKEQMELHERTSMWNNSAFARDAYHRYARLSRLSREVLELTR